ncbi:hypothetical protein Bca101_055583 [Brassica carinata]
MRFQMVVESRRCKGLAWLLKKSAFWVVRMVLLPFGETSAREGDGAALLSSGGSGFRSALRGSGCGCGLILGVLVSRLCFLLPWMPWRFSQLEGELSVGVQVTILRFLKVTIGGHSEVCELSSWFSCSPVSPFGSVAHPSAVDSLLVAYGGAASLILVCRSQSFTGSGAAVVSDPLCVVCSRIGVSDFSLSSVWLSHDSGMLSLPLLLSVNELQVSGENKLDEIVKSQLLR